MDLRLLTAHCRHFFGNTWNRVCKCNVNISSYKFFYTLATWFVEYNIVIIFLTPSLSFSLALLCTHCYACIGIYKFIVCMLIFRYFQRRWRDEMYVLKACPCCSTRGTNASKVFSECLTPNKIIPSQWVFYCAVADFKTRYDVNKPM